MLQTQNLRWWVLRSLLGMAFLLLLSISVLMYEEGWGPGKATFTVLMLFGTGEVVDFEPTRTHGVTQALVVFTAYAGILGMAMLIGAALDIVFRLRLQGLFGWRGKMKDHIILCGLGHVGYRVLTELIKLEQRVIVIERDEPTQFAHVLNQHKIPLITDDVRNDDVLRRADIDTAHAVIACTDDDLVNLEVALDAREMRPGIRVVVRLFDQRLADKIAKGFDIQVAFSSSALAAPAFAHAAVLKTVKGSFYVADRPYVYCEFHVKSGSLLAGRTVKELREEYGVNVLMLQPRDQAMHWAPPGELALPASARVNIVGPFDKVRELKQRFHLADDLRA